VSQGSAETHEAALARALASRVDNTDWLKTFAIICVSAGHIGFFFMDNDVWWSVLGRFAAPVFFFLVGYAQSRTVPLHWIWIGIILTVLESWNADWTWVAPNILLSLALVRLGRPHVQMLVQNHGWTGFVLLTAAILASQPAAAKIVDYGAEGWLWALLGLCQRRYLDSLSAVASVGGAQGSPAPTLSSAGIAGLMRFLACLAAAMVYVWQEQKEFSFPAIPFTVFILGLCLLSASLCLFTRGESRIRPPEKIAGVLRFIGRYTLEIYAIQLAGSELIVKLLPDLAP
jgi:peptidoglycan/LPS O-acetylase OafA/YrhL